AGAFTPEDTAATAYALVFFAAAVVGLSGVQIVTRTFYALHDTRTPVKAGALAVLINTVAALLLLRFTSLSHGGLALAYTVSALCQFGVGLSFLYRALQARGHRFDVRGVASTALRAAAASVVMAAGAYVASQAVGARVDLSGTAGRLLQVAAGLAAGVALYGAFAAAFRMEEVRLVRTLFRRPARQATAEPSDAPAEGTPESPGMNP